MVILVDRHHSAHKKGKEEEKGGADEAWQSGADAMQGHAEVPDLVTRDDSSCPDGSCERQDAIKMIPLNH